MREPECLPTYRFNPSSLGIYCASLMLPSLPACQRHFGIPGVVGYVIFGVLGIALAWRIGATVLARLPRAASWIGLVAVLVGVAIAFLVIFPRANVQEPGRGTDTDDALNVAINEIAHGRYPYYVRTYLGNPPIPMAGGMALAAPYWLFGNAAYQNTTLMVLFAAVVFAATRDVRLTLLNAVIMLTSSPSVLHTLFTGEDRLTNAVYILLFAQALLWAAERGSTGWGIAAAILFGMALAWRANFALVAPIVAAGLVWRQGWRAAALYGTIAIAVAAALTLPFLLYDFKGFAPLHTGEKLRQFRSVVPAADVIVLCLTAAVTLWATCRRANRTDAGLWFGVMVSQWVPFLSVVALASIRAWPAIDIGLLWYGLLVLPFGVYAGLLRIAGKPTGAALACPSPKARRRHAPEEAHAI